MRAQAGSGRAQAKLREKKLYTGPFTRVQLQICLELRVLFLTSPKNTGVKPDIFLKLQVLF